MKLGKIIKIIIAITIIILFCFSVYAWLNIPGEYDEFAKCLTDKDITIYGTEWCGFCKKQKTLFGNSFKYIDFINCDQNRGECISNGVSGYPTWIIKGEIYSGLHTLEELSELSGCELR